MEARLAERPVGAQELLCVLRCPVSAVSSRRRMAARAGARAAAALSKCRAGQQGTGRSRGRSVPGRAWLLALAEVPSEERRDTTALRLLPDVAGGLRHHSGIGSPVLQDAGW